jgi:BRCA1 C Terminus (BRCT) domain
VAGIISLPYPFAFLFAFHLAFLFASLSLSSLFIRFPRFSFAFLAFHSLSSLFIRFPPFSLAFLAFHRFPRFSLGFLAFFFFFLQLIGFKQEQRARVLKEAGAKIVQRLFSENSDRLDYILADKPPEKEVLERAQKADIPVTTVEWVIECVILQELLPLDSAEEFTHV